MRRHALPIAVLVTALSAGCEDPPPPTAQRDAALLPDVAPAPDASALDGAATDAPRDAATLDAMDVTDAPLARDVPTDLAVFRAEPPRTFQDDYLPEFRVDIAPADLQAMLAPGNDARYAMTLRYMGARYPGTIRQRLGNNSSCGAKRQFRIDFAARATLPDGYRTDRFETDRGRCYVLHEWFSTAVARRASQRRPELRLPYRYANAVALYFNDALYHVQTLTEDVNRDLVARYEGTRNVAIFSDGCYGAPADPWLQRFCATFDRAALAPMLDIPGYLYWSAVVKALVPGDNYPDAPYNWSLVRNLDTGLARPLGEDWDEVPRSWEPADADPFTVATPDGDLQRHFTALLADPELRARYRDYLREARAAMNPEETIPLLRAKYAQVRDLLAMSPDLHYPNDSRDWYDDVYRDELPAWLRARDAYLARVLAEP